MGTHPIFESDFDCLTEMGFGPKILGPKCSTCCVVIAVWGIVMFFMLGIFFQIKSPALREDVTVKNASGNIIENPTKDEVYQAYEETAQNCYIAGAMYAGVLFFAGWQMAVNNSRQYQIA